MRVIQGHTVDLISPFPMSQFPRLMKWTHNFKSLINWDYGPQTDEEMAEVLKAKIASAPSWAIIDKNNVSGYNTTDPIVIGAFMGEVASPVNMYLHVISQRRTWGKGLMDEAGLLLIGDVFAENKDLLRVSAAMVANNRAVRNYAYRLGFRSEGLIRDMVIINGQPRDVIHLGLTRGDYNAAIHSNGTGPGSVSSEGSSGVGEAGVSESGDQPDLERNAEPDQLTAV